MPDRDVVALEVVVGQVLPVVRVLDDQWALRLETGDAERLEALARISEPLGEWRQIGVEGDEDEARQRLDAERRQPHALAIEGGEAARLRDRGQLAVLAVGPAVVRAAQHLGTAPGALEDLHGSVAADVRERPQLSVVAAHDRHGLARDVRGGERAGLGHHSLGADEDPGTREDVVELRLEDVAIHVGAGGKGDALVVRNTHVCSSEAMAWCTSARARARPIPPSRACWASPSTSAHRRAALAASSTGGPAQARTCSATSATHER